MHIKYYNKILINNNIYWEEWCNSLPLSQTLSSWPCLSQPLQYIVLPVDSAPREEGLSSLEEAVTGVSLCRVRWMCCDRVGRGISPLLHSLLFQNFSDMLIFPSQYKQPEAGLKAKFYVRFFPSRLWSSVSTLGFEIILQFHLFHLSWDVERCVGQVYFTELLQGSAEPSSAWRELQVVHVPAAVWAVMDLGLGCILGAALELIHPEFGSSSHLDPSFSPMSLWAFSHGREVAV